MSEPSVFVVSRTVRASRARVWAAWTEAARLEKWWGPKGMPLAVLALEVRPGGVFHYSMTLPNGDTWYGRFDYEEVQPPERLVYLSGFADAEGARCRPPFSDTFPLLVRNELELEDLGAETRVTLRAVSVDGDAAAIATFTGMFASMQQGYGSTFDVLEEYLGGGD